MNLSPNPWLETPGQSSFRLFLKDAWFWILFGLDILLFALGTAAAFILKVIVFCVSAFIATVDDTILKPWREETTSRKGWIYGAVWATLLYSMLLSVYLFVSKPQSASLVDVAEEITKPSIVEQVKAKLPGIMLGNQPCAVKCQRIIRESRAKLTGIEENEVSYALAQYNSLLSSGWARKAESCYKEHYQHFEKAQSYTMYPAALIAGKALLEGDGCKFVNAYNGDGGKGPMQITHPSARHIAATTTMLGLEANELQWKGNYLHNVLLGTVMLSDFEDMFRSRGVGMLAYNRGPGNVRNDMRKAGITDFENKVVSDFRGAIPEKAGIGGRPRIYIDKILAASVMMQRLQDGKPLVELFSLSLEDIPGSDPAKDRI